MAKMKYIAGLDVGGTKMLACIYRRNGKCVARYKRKTRPSDGPAKVVNRIVDLVHEVCAEAKISRSQLAGIGVGIPGIIDTGDGRIINAPNLGFQNVPLKAILRKAFKRPVFLLNDADAGLYGEYRYGAARGGRCVLGLFIGTGIGGACIYEGRIFQGGRMTCMEAGHMRLMPEGPVCGCGRHGCLEALASRLVLSAEAAKSAIRGQAPHLYKMEGTDLADIRSSAIAKSIRAGDRAIRRSVLEASRWIAAGTANLVHLLAPDIIVLGGGLVEAMPRFLLKEVASCLAREVLGIYRNSYKLAEAALGDDAIVRGAAAWAERNLEND